MDIAGCDAQRLQLLLQREMPFGKHKGEKLCNLKKDYVKWALENLESLGPDLKLGLEMVQ